MGSDKFARSRSRNAVGASRPAADNWQISLAIADDLGHGEAARSAAIKLSPNHLYEDAASSCSLTFGPCSRRSEKIALRAQFSSKRYCLDDGIWGEWRGPNDDRLPRKFSQSELARLLRRFSSVENDPAGTPTARRPE